MLAKTLAWSAVLSAMLFAALMLTAILARASLGATAPLIVFWGAVPLAGLGIVLAVVLLVTSAFSSDT